MSRFEEKNSRWQVTCFPAHWVFGMAGGGLFGGGWLLVGGREGGTATGCAAEASVGHEGRGSQAAPARHPGDIAARPPYNPL